jgi:fucose 4-O-acetylase-like acetyltransferase
MNRNILIDIMKGAGITLVVLGHAIQKNIPDYQSNIIYNFIYAFHMPLFFIIAGFLMFQTIKGNRLIWLKNKAIYLLIPHIIFNIIYYYMSATNLTIFDNATKWASFLKWMREALFYNSGEWFLWSLFSVLLLLLFIDYVDRKTRSKIFWLFTLVFVVSLSLIPYTGKDLLRIYELQWYFPFALLGYMAAKYQSILKKYRVLVFASALLFPVVMFFTNWHAGWVGTPLTNIELLSRKGSQFTYLVNYSQAITGICVLYIFSIMIRKIKILSIMFERLGSMTIGIYLFSLLFSGLGFGRGAIFIISAFLASMVISIILTLVCRNVKIFGILIGEIEYVKKSYFK